MPKNWVVRYWPFSAYHRGIPTSAGSSVNAPRGCLSRPTDADVVVAQSNSVGTGLGGAGSGGAGVEHIGERDSGQAHHADDRVGIGHRPTAAGRELDVSPVHSGVSDRSEDRVDAHLHRGLAFEAPERVKAHADDGHVVHWVSPLERAVDANSKRYSIGADLGTSAECDRGQRGSMRLRRR